jgi:hypothetical protein
VTCLLAKAMAILLHEYTYKCCCLFSITSKVLRSQPPLGWLICNICVINNHGYVRLVVNTSRAFPRSWLKLTMIHIFRGFKQVSLPDDFAQTSWANWKLLRFSIKALKSLSRKVYKLMFLKNKLWIMFRIDPLLITILINHNRVLGRNK